MTSFAMYDVSIGAVPDPAFFESAIRSGVGSKGDEAPRAPSEWEEQVQTIFEPSFDSSLKYAVWEELESAAKRQREWPDAPRPYEVMRSGYPACWIALMTRDAIGAFLTQVLEERAPHVVPAKYLTSITICEGEDVSYLQEPPSPDELAAMKAEVETLLAAIRQLSPTGHYVLVAQES